MSRRIENECLDKLFAAILKLKNLDECYSFFDDICTVHEMQAMAQRMEVAQMLMQGKTYLEIGEVTGASTATISRVNRSLQFGNDGYKIVFDRLSEEKNR